MMKRIGMPASDDTILRHLKRRAKERRAQASVRVVGIDDWAWRKGSTYGTIIVDLERREVIDLLPVRSAGATADWLKQHPDIEMISRDHCGSLPRALMKARRKRVKSPTASIFCRTCAKPFRYNSAARPDPPLAPYCQQTSTTSARGDFQ